MSCQQAPLRALAFSLLNMPVPKPFFQMGSGAPWKCVSPYAAQLWQPGIGLPRNLVIRIQPTFRIWPYAGDFHCVSVVWERCPMKQFVSAGLFLISVFAGEVSAKDFVPLKGSGSSVYTITGLEFGSCPDRPTDFTTIYLTGEHEANVSHLGRTVATSDVTYDFCNFTYEISLIFEAANRDEFYVSGTGSDVFLANGGADSRFRGIIDDGTGRFKNASGFFDWEGLRFDETPEPGFSVDTFEIHGEISSVGSTRSASPVPEPVR